MITLNTFSNLSKIIRFRWCSLVLQLVTTLSAGNVPEKLITLPRCIVTLISCPTYRPVCVWQCLYIAFCALNPPGQN